MYIVRSFHECCHYTAICPRSHRILAAFCGHWVAKSKMFKAILGVLLLVSMSDGQKVQSPSHHFKRTVHQGVNAVSMVDVCGSECRNTSLGGDYRGQRAVTVSGRTCQSWDSQYPHKHSRNDVGQFPDAKFNEANYCRNPGHDPGLGPWCFTTDPELRWESCGIPLCPDCKMTELGVEYRGYRAQTSSGKTCQRWDSQHPHPHMHNNVTTFPDTVYNRDNFCRNPDRENAGPWCYTTDPDVRREDCGVPKCAECRSSNLGTDYRGQRSVTISGLTCQRWDSQSPHRHSRNDVEQFPDAIYYTENYCRNSEEDGIGPWCYTNDPVVRWETCGIPLCPTYDIET